MATFDVNRVWKNNWIEIEIHTSAYGKGRKIALYDQLRIIPHFDDGRKIS